MHLVAHVRFRSHNKDGDYAIQSAICENPMLNANITALCLIELQLLPIEVLRCGNRNFQSFWLPWPWLWPNDIYELDPYFVDIYRVCENELPTSKVIIWQTSIHTYRQDPTYIPHCFAGGPALDEKAILFVLRIFYSLLSLSVIHRWLCFWPIMCQWDIKPYCLDFC